MFLRNDVRDIPEAYIIDDVGHRDDAEPVRPHVEVPLLPIPEGQAQVRKSSETRGVIVIPL
jgi:hypothetical protein